MGAKVDYRAKDVFGETVCQAIAFAGVAKFPARVKCALLSWMAWKDATAQSQNDLQEESNG